MGFGLELSQSEGDQLMRSWTMIDTNKKYHKDTFMSRLFFNLLAGYPKIAEIFKEGEDISQHSEVFGDLLYMTIVNFRNEEVLETRLNELMMENPLFCAAASSYLEEMGSNLMFTLRQWLGTGIFCDSVQQVWIKLYIYLASVVLQFAQDNEITELHEPDSTEQDSIGETDIPPPRSHARNFLDSDAEESVQALRPRRSSLGVGECNSENLVNQELEQNNKMCLGGSPDGVQELDEVSEIPEGDEVQEARQEDEPEIEEPGSLLGKNCHTDMEQALQLSQGDYQEPATLRGDPSLYVPEKHENPQEISNGNVIRFLISSNQKYKGFRRSVQEGVLQNKDIPIKVPSKSAFKKKNPPLSPPLSPPSLSSGSLKSTFSEEKASFDPRTFGRKSSQSSLLNSGLGKEDGLVRMNIYDSDSSSEIDSMKYSSRRIPLSLSSVSEDDELANENTISSLLQKESESFDPRSRKTRGSFGSESPEEDKSNELSFDPQGTTERYSVSKNVSYGRRSPVFEPESFGLQGLEPISETNDDSDDNDASSSKYGSDDEGEDKGEPKGNNMNDFSRENVSDSEDFSSGISLLSLHSSNYKSSVTSGDATSFEQGKDNIRNTRILSNHKTSNVPYPAIESNHQKRVTSNICQGHVYADSMDALMSFAEQIPKRVSLGFMRSSFVLRKELESPSDNGSIISPKSAAVQRKTPYGVPSSEDCKPFNSFDSFKKENSPKVLQQSNSFERVRNNTLNALPRRQQEKQEITSQSAKSSEPSLRKSSSWRNRLGSLFSKSSNLSDENSVYSTDSKFSLAGFSIFSGFSNKKRSKYLVFLASRG